MTIDPTISIGSIITLLGMLVAGVGVFFAVKHQSRQNTTDIAALGVSIENLKNAVQEGLKTLEGRVHKVEQDLHHMQLRLAEQYVSREVLKEHKEEIGKRFDRVEELLTSSRIAREAPPPRRRRSSGDAS